MLTNIILSSIFDFTFISKQNAGER